MDYGLGGVCKKLDCIQTLFLLIKAAQPCYFYDPALFHSLFWSVGGIFLTLFLDNFGIKLVGIQINNHLRESKLAINNFYECVLKGGSVHRTYVHPSWGANLCPLLPLSLPLLCQKENIVFVISFSQVGHPCLEEIYGFSSVIVFFFKQLQ